MRVRLLAATLVLVAGGAAGCSDDGAGGGSGHVPSTKEFCGALEDFENSVAGVDPTKDLAGYVKNLKDQADKLDALGTPEDMPDDARDGFAITIDKIQALSDDATTDDLGGLGDVSDEEQKKLDALKKYIERTCPDLGNQTDSESPQGGG